MKKIGAIAIFLVICSAPPELAASEPSSANPPARTPVLYFFWGTGCPHCEKAKRFVAGLQERHPELTVRSIDVMARRDNLELWARTAERFGTTPRGVPAFYIGERAFTGFSQQIAERLESYTRRLLAEVSADRTERSPPSLEIPLVGEIRPERVSLPVFTLIIAGLDSFNPCAFFVLLFLLSLLVHARSRTKMLLVGGIFVLFSGGIYFLFMAAWLNLFLLLGNLSAVTAVAGILALFLGLVNVKDYFFFRTGVTLSIPETAKPGLFARMRNLVRSESLPALLTGTVVLALTANSYELLCTAGFPMVFTRVLTLQNLPQVHYYLYLGLYNLVYVMPLAVIVGIFVATLGSRKLSERQGRILKLLSGLMMVLLGGVLLIRPTLLNTPLWSAALLAGALLVTVLIVAVTRRRGSGDKTSGAGS